MGSRHKVGKRRESPTGEEAEEALRKDSAAWGPAEPLGRSRQLRDVLRRCCVAGPAMECREWLCLLPAEGGAHPLAPAA